MIATGYKEWHPWHGLWGLLAALLLSNSVTVELCAQIDAPRLLPGAPNPFTPTNAPWNQAVAYTPGGGGLVLTNRNAEITNSLPGYALRNRIGSGVVPLNAQYGIGDMMFPPDEATGPGWVPIISQTNGNPSAAQWLTYANTNLFIAVDEGVALVTWTNASTTNRILQTYVIGPNLTRRPVRLFWTEGQYSGPRVRFGNSYEVKIHYNSQIPDPTNNPANVTNIANEQISQVNPPTIFLKNNELRATAGAKGRVVIAYSRRPEGFVNRELLGFEVIDVLEPMSSTIPVYVGDRLLPRRTNNPTNALFCDVTRGGVDVTGQRPDEIFAYKHSVGRRNGWVWAIRPTDAPWQLEIFWKAKEQLDVIWPFEVDIYDVSWNPNSQLCALVSQRGGTPAQVYFPQEVLAQVMPYQAIETSGGAFAKSSSAVASVDAAKVTAHQPGMCTMKYTGGDDVWFETIRIVPELSPLVYHGVKPWPIGAELKPFVRAGYPQDTTGSYDTWPARLRVPQAPPTGSGITNVPGDRWDRHHPELYTYPSAYPQDETGLQSQVFAVNAGHLSLWWWNPSKLFAQEAMPQPIYWPSRVCDYRNEWPQAGPELVIASFQGSSYGGLHDDGTSSLHFFGNGLVGVQGTALFSNVWGNRAYDEGFTFETWVNPNTVSGHRGIMNMRSANGTNIFGLFVGDGLVGAMAIGSSLSSISSNSWYATQSVLSNEWTHIAVSVGTNGTLSFYVNGQAAGTHTNLPSDLGGMMFDSVALGGSRSWDAEGLQSVFGFFEGSMDETRMWWGTRREEQVLAQYATSVDVASNPEAVFRFDYKPERVVLHEFQQKPVDITGLFFLNIGGETATLNDAPNSGITLRGEGTTYAGKNARVYVQNAAGSAGYNPNEEHALLVGPLAYALRNDLNKTNNAPDATSQPFVLIEYSKDATNWQRSIDVYLVTATNREFPRFQQRMEAGRMIQPPAPLRSVLPDNCVRTDRDISAHLYVFRDRLRYFWAKQAGDSGQPLEVGMRFFYPMQLGFWIPQLSAGDQPAPLTEVPWLSALGQANPPASPQSWMAGQSW